MRKRMEIVNPIQDGDLSNFDDNERGSLVVLSHDGFQNNSQLNLNK